MPETFIAKIQLQNRVAVPKLVRKVLKVKEGSEVRVTIEKLG